MKWLGFTLTALVFLLGLFLIQLSFSLDKNQKYLKEVSVRTEGIIVGEVRHKDDDSKIQYEVDGEKYTIYASIGRVSKGVRCSVHYDPNDPENAVVDLDYYDNVRLIGILLGGFMFGGIGMYGMYKSWIFINSKGNEA